MPRNNINSRALRKLAEDLVQRITEDCGLPEDMRGDFVTSVVRQWITYDGNATLFLDHTHQVYLVLGRMPLGEICVVPEPVGSGWLERLTEDWKINRDDIPGIIDQLNCCQSAEVTNSDGIQLRLWVNPKERRKGIESIPPGMLRDYYKIAASELERQFGKSLDRDEMDELIRSVVKQWQKYDGYACLFVDKDRELVVQVREHANGNCGVVTRGFSVNLESSLATLGIPPEIIPEVITRFKLGQEMEFPDSKGVHSRLWYDPKGRQMCVQPLGGEQSGVRTIPSCCPKCWAVLRSWGNGQRQQNCPLCGHTVALS